MKKKSKKKNQSLILILAVVFVVIAVFIGLLIFYQFSRAPKAKVTTKAVTSAEKTTEKQSAAGKPQPEAGVADAGKYYSENAQKLIRVTPAKKSAKLYSEKQIGKELTERGFGEAPITYEYSIDGSMGEKTEIDTSSSRVHPQYTVTYVTQSGDYWTVSVCNNCVTAYPVTYHLEHGNNTELMITESDSITAYDSKTNSFYEVVPKPSVLVTKKIPAITAEALEQLTAQEIDAL